MPLPDSRSTGDASPPPRPVASGTRKEEEFLLFDPAPEEIPALSPESAASLRSLAASFVEEKNPAPAAGEEEAFSLTEVADRLKTSLLARPAEDGETEALDLLTDQSVEPERKPLAAAETENLPEPVEPEPAPEALFLNPPPPPALKRIPLPPAGKPVAKPVKSAAAGKLRKSIRVSAPVPPPAPEPVVPAPVSEPETAPEPESPRVVEPEPVVTPPVPTGRPVIPPPEVKPEPLPPPEPAAAPPPPVDSGSMETALVLAGALLIFTGLASACAFAAGWLMVYHTPYDEQFAQRAAVPWRAFGAAGAVAGLTIGWGCLLRRRWAPPLLAATARSVLTAAMAALAGMALHAALISFFPSVAGDDFASSAGLILPATGALAILFVSATALAFAENEKTEGVCRAADPRPRWTDRARPGALPLFTASLLLPVFYFAAMGFGAPPPPGEQSAATCLPLLGALCVLMKFPRAAWWLLLIFAVVVTAWHVPRLPVPSSPAFAEAVSRTVALFLFPSAILFLSRGVLSRRR